MLAYQGYEDVRPPTMTKLPLLLLGLGLLPGIVLVACSTDNGDAIHGEQFGPPPDRKDGSTDGPVSVDPDGGGGISEAGADGDAPLTTCTSGTVAVLAGNDATLTGAVQVAGGAWSGASISGGAAKSPPSLVAFGTGFTALTRGPADVLQAVAYGASWSAAVAVTGTPATIDTPALAVVGTKAEGVFLSDTNKFFRIENAGTSWSAPDPVTPPAGGQSFGPSAGTVAAAGTDLVFAQNGSDNGLYYQVYGGAWSTGLGVFGAGTLPSSSPVLVAIDGKFDLVLLYPDKSAPNVIGHSTRDKGTKAWSSAAVTHALAQSATPFSAAAISPTTLLVTFAGNDSLPYVMKGTIGATAITWTAPTRLVSAATTVDSAPSVAKGVCGDDAIAVFATAGQVKATRYRGGSWSAPESVSGASGGRVAVATR